MQAGAIGAGGGSIAVLSWWDERLLASTGAARYLYENRRGAVVYSIELQAGNSYFFFSRRFWAPWAFCSLLHSLGVVRLNEYGIQNLVLSQLYHDQYSR
jgi:hypothetical protein